MLFFSVAPFWAMAFFLGLFLLVFPTQRFAASSLILISMCAAVGSVLASIALTLDLACKIAPKRPYIPPTMMPAIMPTAAATSIAAAWS